MQKQSKIVLALACCLVGGGALAQESKVQLKDAPGRDKAMQCIACHSVDYIEMNSRFLEHTPYNTCPLIFPLRSSIDSLPELVILFAVAR